MLSLTNVTGNFRRIAENGRTDTAERAAQGEAELGEASGDAPMVAPERATATSPLKNPASLVDIAEDTERGQTPGDIAATLPTSLSEGNAAVHSNEVGDPGCCPKSASRHRLYPAANTAAPAKTGVRASAIHASTTPGASEARPRKDDEAKPSAISAAIVLPESSPGVLRSEIHQAASALQPQTATHPDPSNILQSESTAPTTAGAVQVTMAGAPFDAGIAKAPKPAASPESGETEPTRSEGASDAGTTAREMKPTAPPQGRMALAPKNAGSGPTGSTDVKATQQPATQPESAGRQLARPMAPTDPVSIRPAIPEVVTGAETVRQTRPATPPGSGAMLPVEAAAARGAESITPAEAAAPATPGAMREAKPAVTADAGTIPLPKAAPAESAPLPGVAAMPETTKTTPVHTADPVPQPGAGSAVHHSVTRASEGQTEIHPGKEESPVRILVPQVSGSRSIPVARATPRGLAQTENPPVAIQETPAASPAPAAISRVTNFVPASQTSLPPSSPPANAAAAFEQMDAASPPQVLASSPHGLAVGIHDSGLGWVEIRTHAAAGQISAVLATGSNEARAAATAYLPEVREYLAGQQVAVGHLSAETYSPSSGDRGGSPDGRPGDSGTAHQAGPTAERSQENFADESVDDSVSYINVRV